AIGDASGSKALTMAGGTLTLANADTYSGGTYLIGGSLSVGHPAALGTGAATFGGGILTAAYKLTVGNTINIPNTTAVFGGASNLTLSGAVNLLGSSILTTTNTGLTTLSGAIGGQGALLTTGSSGPGGLQLNGSANTYTGGTYVNAGN